MSRTRIPAFALAVLGLSWGSARAADPPAQDRLEALVKAYRALPAYSDRGAFTLTLKADGKTSRQVLPIEVSFVRPDKVRVETDLAGLVTDGKQLTTSLKALKKYAVGPAPRPVNFETLFAEGPVSSAVLGGPAGPPLLVLLNLLLADDPAKVLRGIGDQIKALPDADFEGKSCEALELAAAGQPTIRLWVDPATKLLRGIDLVLDPKALAETLPAGDAVTIETFRWVAGAVETKPLADQAFTFEAPKGFARVDELAEAAVAAGTEPAFATEALVGKPAPSFTLTVLDGPDKTRTLTKADLTGKVVLLDFWATWCAPCLLELPEIQKLIEAYAADKKDVVVVAVSQDEGGPELAAVRKLVEETLTAKKLNLTVTPVGKVAIDPTGKLGTDFAVEGLPTLVLIDRDGNVRAASEGYDPDAVSLLRKQIDALLAGKPLPGEKPPAGAGRGN